MQDEISDHHATPDSPGLRPGGIALQQPRRPVKASIIYFIALVCAALIAMYAWGSWTARQVELDKAEIETRNVAWALAGQAEHSIKLVDTVLVGMVESLEAGGVSPRSSTNLLGTMHKHGDELEMLQGLFVYDQEGRLSSHSAAARFENRDKGGPAFFQYHKTHPGRGPHVSAPIFERATGQWLIPVSRRVQHADGSFAGVALATIRIDFFRNFYESVDVGRDGAIVLSLDNGTLLVRLPFDATQIGLNVTAGPVFQLLRARGPVDSGVLMPGMDGHQRMYSYRHLNNYPMVVAVARSTDDLLAQWRRSTALLTVGLLLLITGVLALGSRLVRQIAMGDTLQSALHDAKGALETSNAALEHSNAALTALAFSDALTGLPNRRRFEDALNREFHLASRTGSSLALVLIDADHFKKYNDLYGHPAGDNCLRTIAKAIESGLRRPGDVASRYGGEEFAVLLPGTDLEGAAAVGEAIRAAVQGEMLEHTGNPTGVITISAGACAWVPRAHDTDPEALVREADRALYIAKSQGRNRVSTV